jgi:tetratricopeptide (TPR) repeat protein
MNFRVQVINAGLQTVASMLKAQTVRAVEVGCMFKADEGLSTAVIASFLQKRGGNRRFLSIEYDRTHISAAQRILCGLEPDLLPEVTFACGNSLDILPQLIREWASIDFALLDGGGHPGTCLREFELVLEGLSENGLIVVDDLHDMAPTPHYSAARPFGKGTLILPWLIMADYFGHCSRGPDAALFKLIRKEELTASAREIRFTILSRQRHRMLVAGREHAVRQALRSLEAAGITASVLGEEYTEPAACAVETVQAGSAARTISAASFDSPKIREVVARREDVRLQELWGDLKRVFPLVSESDLRRAMRAVCRVQEGIRGRHCGDLADRLSQYLSIVQYTRATGAATVHSLEIGTLFGGSCLVKLMALRDYEISGTVTCIDPMKGYYESPFDEMTGLPVNAQTLYENLDKFGFPPERIDLRQLPSGHPDASIGMKPESFAVIMLDGDHSHEGIRRDWDLYSRFLRRDGVVLIDDYADPSWPDVTVFVEELRSADATMAEVGRVGTTFLLSRAPAAFLGRGAQAATDPHDDAISFLGLIGDLAAEEPGSEKGQREAFLRTQLQSMFQRERYLNLALIAFNRQDWPKAEEYYGKATTLEGTTPAVSIDGWIGLAECCSAQGRQGEAEEYLKKAVALEESLVCLDFNGSKACTSLARLYASQRKWEAARTSLSRALEVHGASCRARHEIFQQLGWTCLKLNQYSAGINHFAAALTVPGIDERQQFYSLIGQGKCLIALKQCAQAEKAFRQAVGIAGAKAARISPEKLGEAMIGLAQSLAGLHRGGDAEKVYRTALALGGLPPKLRFQLLRQFGCLHVREDRAQDAESAFREALAVQNLDGSDRLSLMLHLGRCLLSQDRSPETEELLRNACRLAKEAGLSHYGAVLELGNCLMKQSKFKAAEQEFSRALGFSDTPPAIRVELARRMRTAILEGQVRTA